MEIRAWQTRSPASLMPPVGVQAVYDVEGSLKQRVEEVGGQKVEEVDVKRRGRQRRL